MSRTKSGYAKERGPVRGLATQVVSNRDSIIPHPLVLSSREGQWGDGLVFRGGEELLWYAIVNEYPHLC